MKVYKFGGASLSSSTSVKAMGSIVGTQDLKPDVIVVSAMAKTTNRLEIIYHSAVTGASYEKELDELIHFHHTMADELGLSRAMNSINSLFDQLRINLEATYSNYNEGYDQVIPFGELLSSQIIKHYLEKDLGNIHLVDARRAIVTNNHFRQASVNWEDSEEKFKSEVVPFLSSGIIVSQGFIGATREGQTTTLGREGSDFTGAIFASNLNADSLTVWKDVPGILNADPKLMKDATKFQGLSYGEVAEMSYYGAKVIHPKTIRPLANKAIPLIVKPFGQPNSEGTLINEKYVENQTPVFVFKNDQTLVSFKVEDFTFINEAHLVQILDCLTALDIKINLMQNSAISFSICIDGNEKKLGALIERLQDNFAILYNDQLQLITVKNYNQQAIDRVNQGKEILLEQRSRHNYQIVVR